MQHFKKKSENYFFSTRNGRKPEKNSWIFGKKPKVINSARMQTGHFCCRSSNHFQSDSSGTGAVTEIVSCVVG